ncbi:ABC transporter substrate-binding protein, partial [Ottowia sp.]|uniref:ABC transporter substrate-binding protein n=1 Tax=Ottowia sp. TaxID=1898956 RepID=UPI003A83738C
ISRGERSGLTEFKDAFEAAGGLWHETVSPNYDLMRRDVVMRVAVGLPPSALWMGAEDRSIARMLDFLRPIDELAPPGWADLLNPAARALVDSAEQAVQLPITIHNENWAWYNARVFRQLGLALPRTWEEFLAQAPLLAGWGVAPLAVSDEPWAVRLLLSTMVAGQGGPQVYQRLFVQEDPQVFEHPRMQQVLRTFLALRRWANAPGTAPGWSDATRLVRQGRAAMQVMGDWARAEFADIGPQASQDLVCAPPPDGQNLFIAAIDMFAFPRGATNLAGQKLLTKLVLQPDLQVQFARRKGSVPVLKTFDAQALHACERSVLPLLASAQTQVMAPRSTLDEGPLARWMDVAFRHWRSPDSTLAAVTADMREALRPHPGD